MSKANQPIRRLCNHRGSRIYLLAGETARIHLRSRLSHFSLCEAVLQRTCYLVSVSVSLLCVIQWKTWSLEGTQSTHGSGPADGKEGTFIERDPASRGRSRKKRSFQRDPRKPRNESCVLFLFRRIPLLAAESFARGPGAGRHWIISIDFA